MVALPAGLGLLGGTASANVPHKLTATGTVERHALALILHDSRETVH
jgi:hypothetical protein